MAINYLKKAIKTPSSDDNKTRAAVQSILNDIEKRREESIKEISYRIDEALKFIPKEKLIAAPDCGLGHLPRKLVKKKLKTMVEAVKQY